ncbi:MAG: 16S rRNA (cytidine(1402)-2'-O)-methyltransferase [Deltaproteobacteria bacterium]|nr:16S rRNA (cytidine(1402)-2'-O)-methyltransferase [Deltaproteobacteria bacterium]
MRGKGKNTIAGPHNQLPSFKTHRQPNQGKRQYQGSGTLYVVSTPLGNLEDITLRALKTLKEVDLIAAESVGHTRGLCNQYSIKTKTIRYNQHNQKTRTPDLINRLRSGHNIAIVTNAGTPAVSDPGNFLISRALDSGIRVSPIPGPSAVTAAMSVSGMGSGRFRFVGFLAKRAGQRRKELEALGTETSPMVFFEAPQRLAGMLRDLKDVLGNRQIVLLKEMTKIYEEVRRGRVSEILEEIEEETPRGEYTVVVAGREKSEKEPPLDSEILKKLEKLLGEGTLSTRQIAEQVSAETQISYRKLYKAILSLKRNPSLAKGDKHINH